MQPRPDAKNNRKAIVSFILILAIVLVVAGAGAYNSRQRTTPVTVSAAPAGAVNVSASRPSPYKDGTYQATSNYIVPSGKESIKLTLTVKSGVVTDSSIVNSESNFQSAQFQLDFVDAYKQYVVGKKVNEIKLDYVAGASETTLGFNQALSRIAQQAQA